MDETAPVRPVPRRPVDPTAGEPDFWFTDIEDGEPDGYGDESYLDAAVL